MKTLELIFDFASPNAYLVYEPVKQIAERTGAQLILTPCLLGGIFKSTNNQPPFIAFAEVKGKTDYNLLEFRRFIKKHNLSKFKMNPHFPLNTLLIMRGMIVAKNDGRLDEYVTAALHHMWEEPKDMADPEVAAAALTESGFDGSALLAQTQDADIKQELVSNTAHAVERGVFGIPTFFVGDEMFFGKERLGQVEEELVSQA